MGLLDQQQGQQPPQQQNAPQPEQQGAPQSGKPQGSDLSPEQIAALKQGVQAGQRVIYNKEVFAGMMQDMQKKDPIEVLASTIVQVLQKIQGETAKVDFVVTLSIGIALLDDVAAAITETGQAQFSPDDQAAALQQAVQMWLTANAGKYDKNEIMGAAQQMGGQQQQPQQPPQQGVM